MVLVILLGVSFVAIVLLPGLKLAGDLVNSSAALKWVADQQRYPTIIRASLETMRDRLTNRGYLQESVDQLTDATKKFGDAVQIMTTPRPGGWLGVRHARIGGRLDRRPAAPVRCAMRGDRSSGRSRPVLTLQQRALCRQRVAGHGAQRHRAAARARSDHGHPHQPPLAAGARNRARPPSARSCRPATRVPRGSSRSSCSWAS